MSLYTEDMKVLTVILLAAGLVACINGELMSADRSR